jgi:predicted nucleic acid-binding protein
MLVDTSGLFAIFVHDDPFNGLARVALESAAAPFTHSAVLTEFIALVEIRRRNRHRAIALVRSIIEGDQLSVVWLIRDDYTQAIALLEARPDKHYSLCDALSFLIMRRMNIREALTTDGHFEQEGFVRLLKAD